MKEEDCFQRYDEGQECKRKRIEVFQTRQEVEYDATPKPDHMHPDKGHAATKAGHLVRQTVGVGTIGLRGFLEFRDRLHVTFGNVFDCARLVIVRIKGTGRRRDCGLGHKRTVKIQPTSRRTR